ncbi:MAG: ComEA family DNA-binding protein, partial [bacterium]
MTREQQLLILGLILLIISGLGVMIYRRTIADTDEILIEQPQAQGQTLVAQSNLIVHVTGRVVREGVYKLKSGDRIIDAIEAAGGCLPGADLSALNLAEKVKDGEKIVVSRRPENQSPRRRESDYQSSRETESTNGRVSLNSAGEKDLCGVKGIGPSMAKRILDYRQSNGPFGKLDDLMKVKGIGKGTFGKIKGY